MEKGIKLGVYLINDISGLNFDNETINVLKKTNIPFVLHHIQGNPKTMQKNPKSYEGQEVILYYLVDYLLIHQNYSFY